ncbi:unnamed protein product [Rotaria sordida]|uniref:G-protein coupled receptors family 1 profile domain-containing protein n=1 Tax=Rotaria sordida TaxID=392033 RepID=A0A819IBB3_9BILA|nr:unnamed protein product [Rotaria sordida]CAF1450874.1 unnamed protein product [Rotaria sordida]CAF3915767.1 unnamed protein product [Rotaria sordida]CAF3925971.1 unnamed protein product [Rotaria sordida]
MNQLNSTMSSLSSVNLIAAINNVTLQLVRYFSIFIFLFGSIGNILNVLALSQRVFRSNPCAVFFLFSSVVNFIAILSGLLSRILSGWGTDLTATNRFFCKLRGFVVNIARSVAIWYILFAMIDRWLLSCSKLQRRRMSSLKNAQRAMIISLIVATLVFSHVIYCHEPNLINAPQKCYGITITCRFVTDVSFLLLAIIFPLPLMLMFGLMTIYNIRQSKARVAHRDITTVTNTMTTNTKQQRRLTKQDYNLLVMLLVQIFILFILSLPLGFQKLYSAIVVDRTPSALNDAIENLVYNLAQLLHFLANGMPFYIYTLAGGKVFPGVSGAFVTGLGLNPRLGNNYAFIITPILFILAAVICTRIIFIHRKFIWLWACRSLTLYTYHYIENGIVP